MLIHLKSDSPLRPPDWRWKKVVVYKDARRAFPRSHSDSVLSKVFQFHTALEGCADDEFAHLDLLEEYPNLTEAHLVYSDDGSSSSKWELEARLLAKESYEEISNKMCISKETVDTYEKVFFNIADRLTNRSWIINCVIGRSIHVGLSERDYDLLWKMYALFGGPFMLDVAINRLGLREQRAESLEQAESMINDSLEVQAKIVASKSFVIAPINGFTASTMIQIEQTYRQIAKNAAGISDTQTVMQSVSNIMTSLPWSVGSGTMKHPVLEVLKEADNRAAELRGDEMLAIANGEPLLGLKDLRLPEPEEKTSNE